MNGPILIYATKQTLILLIGVSIKLRITYGGVAFCLTWLVFLTCA
jgi:hypothetical protein